MARFLLSVFALALIAAAVATAQTYTYAFRLTPQADGTILAEPFEGEPPTTLEQKLETTWNETCLQVASERYKLIAITWNNGAASYSETDLTPGGSTVRVDIVPLVPPAGFAVLGILADQGAAAPLAFPGDAATAAKLAAAWIASSWAAAGDCRTIRLRWVVAKAYPRLDMNPPEWQVAAAQWPVSATVTVGP